MESPFTERKRSPKRTSSEVLVCLPRGRTASATATPSTVSPAPSLVPVDFATTCGGAPWAELLRFTLRRPLDESCACIGGKRGSHSCGSRQQQGMVRGRVGV